MAWACAGTCGDLSRDEYPLHGDDGEWYCPRLDCTARAVWISVGGWKRTSWKTSQETRGNAHAHLFTDDAGEKKAPPKRRTAAQRRRDEEVYARLREREEARKSGRRVQIRPAKMKKDERPKMTATENHTRATAERYGTCSKCKRGDVYLLSTKRALCSACVPKAPGDAAKKRKRRRKSEPEEDLLTREVRAIETCARALDGLDAGTAERVLWYVAQRYKTTLGGDTPALPGSHTAEQVPADS